MTRKTNRRSSGIGRGRRIRLPGEFSKRFFELKKLLGHQRPGLTLEWLLENSKEEIEDLRSKKAVNHDNDVLVPSPSSSLDESGLTTSPRRLKTVLPPFVYGMEIVMDFSPDEVARFL
ncbi:transcription factor TCP7-like [Ipomoea triloba]|uniref:transcription factor TCP7-like n=1 Tax=Ipomoea triloba TaxID=35885 RepID=UPI00125D6B89|nr:transcription factor TCP7-like [Ipomoea triloba]